MAQMGDKGGAGPSFSSGEEADDLDDEDGDPPPLESTPL